MKKLFLTLVISILFVAFSNAQTEGTQTEESQKEESQKEETIKTDEIKDGATKVKDSLSSSKNAVLDEKERLKGRDEKDEEVAPR